MKFSIFLVIILTAGLHAEALKKAFRDATYDGYIRVGYQKQLNREIAIGGKLHLETAPISNISFGTSFYTTQGITKKQNIGVLFFSSDKHSYSILGEVYIKAEISNSIIKIGRQELDSPFADSDDIGMIANTFEALTIVNNNLQDITIIFAHLYKMSGIDAKIPEEFNNLNDNNGMQIAGLTYYGIKNTSLQGWFYNLLNFAQVTYIEANYKSNLAKFEIAIDGQYMLQHYYNDNKVDVYGINFSLGLEEMGVVLYIAYNKAYSTNEQRAENFFGGGPFFTNCEHLTMKEVGANGMAYRYGIKVDSNDYGIKNFEFNVSYLEAKGDGMVDLNELDIMANYDLNDQLSFNLIYSNMKNNTNNSESFINTRFFANYKF